MRCYRRACWTAGIVTTKGIRIIKWSYSFGDFSCLLSSLIHNWASLTVTDERSCVAIVDPVSGVMMTTAVASSQRVSDKHYVEFRYVYDLFRRTTSSGVLYSRSVVSLKSVGSVSAWRPYSDYGGRHVHCRRYGLASLTTVGCRAITLTWRARSAVGTS